MTNYYDYMIIVKILEECCVIVKLMVKCGNTDAKSVKFFYSVGNYKKIHGNVM